MHYNLLFNGCSFTDGTELEGKNYDYEYRNLNRYSHVISEKLKKTYDNISKGSNSNDRIVRDTINWFESGNTCDLVIIQFTSICRYEWVADDGSYIGFLPNHLQNSKSSMKKNDFLRYNFITDLYYKSIYNKNLGINSFYKNLFLLETYFRSKNIKYYFIKLFHNENACDDSKSTWKNFCEYHLDTINSIVGQIIPPKKDNSFYYCQQYLEAKFPHLKGVHPNELGHQKIAEHIIDAINNIL